MATEFIFNMGPKSTLIASGPLPSKMAAAAITKNSENMKQTISHELLNVFCQNMCHSDAFIEFLM